MRGCSVGAVLAALAVVPGLDVSQQVGAGGWRCRRGALSATGWAMRLAVEAFGAVGDGVTDDTAAIDLAAVSSGRPVRFGARTYVLNGQWTVTVCGGAAGRWRGRRC